MEPASCHPSGVSNFELPLRCFKNLRPTALKVKQSHYRPGQALTAPGG
jgi:hypothetical protein